MKVSTFLVEEMCCPTEERAIRDRLSALPGVESLEFNLMSRTLRVAHSIDPSRIISEVSTTGMKAVPQDDVPVRAPVEPPTPLWRRLDVQVLACAGVLALLAEILALVVGESTVATRAVAVVSILIAGRPMLRRAWSSLRTISLNINVLMTIATIGAIAIGEWSEAAMVVFLFAVAELIEEHSLDRARSAVRGLMELAPSTANVLRGPGWMTVPVESVEIGETVRIKPGERLPLDGRVLHGAGSVDQAPITGESMPVDKAPGDQVFAGSINVSGTFDFDVTHTASDSTIGRIARLVEEAGGKRAASERFIDRFARIYTPAMIGIAALVVLVPPILFGAPFEPWLYRGLVLLVIGCPCALVISTPVTVVSGLAAAARRGILIKGGMYLEAGRELRAVAFDKTGTLTIGRPEVTDVVALDGCSDRAILGLASAVEERSEHPIAAAIVAAHRAVNGHFSEPLVSDFRSIPGRGALASVGGRNVAVGNHRFAHDLDACTPALERALLALEQQGKTSVVVIAGEDPIGVIGVADTLRTGSSEAIARLHEFGLRTLLLTGDNATTAAAVARHAGIDDVRAELMPEDKISAVEAFQAEVGALAMVGDGINDVPALAAAHVGIAMGVAGSDIALETADVALMDDNLMKVPEFITLSRRTHRLMTQNISIALGLKAIFFAMALAGVATLWMAVFADMGASLLVVFNGLRLLRTSPQSSTPTASVQH